MEIIPAIKNLLRRSNGQPRNRQGITTSLLPLKWWAALFALCILVLGSTACGGWWRSKPPSASDVAANDKKTDVTSPIAADPAAGIIRELEERVKRNPDDFIAFSKLGGYYLQRLRETGDVKYLELATRAARASLAILPAEQNAGALGVLAQSEFAAHDFTGARDHAQQLISLDPRKSYPYLILGDALLELGDYERAEEAFARMRQAGGEGVGAQTRLARVDALRGRTENARARISNALSMALAEVPQQRETVAWCRWQLGEAAFSLGNYEEAERRYREALTDFPDYYRAVGSLARVLAARGNLGAATEQAERAVRLLPDPSFLALLGDLYKLSGREREASVQYALIEKIAHLSEINGVLYNRQLAVFYADHNLKPAAAYELAAKEYKVRRDIYGADAAAWTALKAGKVEEAQALIKEALRLGTQDAKLLYHAGMIEHAAGNHEVAHNFLKRALELNPQFDALQASVARKSLES